jgi:hypothetical protein
MTTDQNEVDLMETNREEHVAISLTPEIESALIEQARRQGTTPEILALDCLRERFVPTGVTTPSQEDGKNLADFLADHIGVLSSSERAPGGAQMSQECGRKFAAGLITQRERQR